MFWVCVSTFNHLPSIRHFVFLIQKWSSKCISVCVFVWNVVQIREVYYTINNLKYITNLPSTIYQFKVLPRMHMNLCWASLIKLNSVAESGTLTTSNIQYYTRNPISYAMRLVVVKTQADYQECRGKRKGKKTGTIREMTNVHYIIVWKVLWNSAIYRSNISQLK